MSVVFQCPACSSSFRVALEHAGQLVKCPSCEEAVSIPKDLGQTTSQATPSKSAGVTRCPSCNGEFRVSEKYKNQPVACPHCNATVTPSGKGSSPTEADMFAPGHRSNPQPEKPTIQVRTGKKKKSGKAPVKISLPKPPSVTPPAPAEPTPQPSLPKPVTLPKPDVSQKRKPKPAAEVAPPKASKSKTPPKVTEPPKPAFKKKPATPPPTTSESASEHDSTKKAANETEPQTAITSDPPNSISIAHRLPPKFTAVDPDDPFAAASREEDHKVILPDGDGGFQRIDSRVVHVERDGKKLQLYSAPKEKKERRRFLQNILAILIGIIVLAAAFYLLLNW